MLLKRLVLAALVLLVVAASPAWAQDYGRPPADVGDGDSAPYRGGGGADGGDPALTSVRVGKLESRIRDMTGQIEELQNANRKLVEQLQKFQADVEFRLQEKGSPRQKRSEATPLPGENGPAMDAVGIPPKMADTKKGVESKSSRNDAFDPSAVPLAPGAPKPLGSTASAAPDDAPMDLTGGGLRSSTSGSGAIAPSLPPPSSSSAMVTPGGTIIANTAPNSPKEEFDVALGYYKDKQYESAEKGFTTFIGKNPKSRLVADATYYIGESFAQRGRNREAAEQYLKISTDFANSARAPEAMLRLGVSLKALGAKEQACATFTEVGRKYPNAPTYVKTGAEREAKRAQC